MKNWLRSLQLSPAERNGSIVLIVLILGMLGARLCLILWQPALPNADMATYQRDIAEFEADTLLELNAASLESLVELPGIGPSMAEKIIAYRNELGGFYYLEQLMDIPGIGETKLNGLRPYITIDTSLAKIKAPQPDSLTHTPLPAIEDTTTQWPVKLKTGEQIELNTAQIEELQRLPGIGLAFAQRIDAYRNRLGGYHDLEQLKEVSGVGEAKYSTLLPHLTLNKNRVKKLDVNTASREQLLAHPYCTQAWVTELIGNRPYANLGQLPQNGLDKRLLPYLVIDK